MTTPAVAAISAHIFPPIRLVDSAPAEVDLVSVYEFDAVSAADSEGGVNGTINGAFASLGSIIQGVGGTSFYKDGDSSHITLPAGQAAHNLGALSLGIYYQPTAHTKQHTLLAVGDGTQPGDLLVAVRTDGRLLASHVGSDGGLRFFGSSDGIATTNLQIGNAYKITATLGPAGAHLFLNNTEVASIPQNTNGWNNSRVKFIGVASDGVSNGLEGLIDRFRVWQGQLQTSGVAALTPAQAIAIDYEKVVWATRPVGWWSLNGTLIDHVARRDAAVAAGSETYTTGLLGGSDVAFNCAGTNWLEVPHNAALKPSVGAIMVWHRPAAVHNGVVVAANGPGLTNPADFAIRNNLSGSVSSFFQQSGATALMETSAGYYSAGLVIPAIVTFDANGTVMYLFGNPIPQTTTHASGLLNNTLDWRFGNQHDTSTIFNGAIAHIAVWNRVPTLPEIWSLSLINPPPVP